ncbi:MAG: endonuclease V [Thermoplasmatota archaeon]
MDRVIKIDGIGSFTELKEKVLSFPTDREEMWPYLEKEVLPEIDMARWAVDLLEELPGGSFSSFGSLARGLGSERAARAVGELAASGKLARFGARLVYSDGRIPDSVAEESGCESPRIAPELIVKFEARDPPLGTLSLLQDRLIPFLREERAVNLDIAAGLDISSRDDIHTSAMAVMDRAGSPVDGIVHTGRPGIPYVPGLLFYREAPLLLPLVRKGIEKGLIDDSVLLVLDGNGILHPRRIGIACQIGIITGTRTCGIAKKLMLGRISHPKRDSDEKVISEVSEGEEVLGWEMRMKGLRPVYLSRGHRTDLLSAAPVIRDLWRTRVPEPTRTAHIMANEHRRSETPP